MRALTLALLLTATPALAEVQMTAEEFEAYTTGRTVTYAYDGQPNQMEQYLPGRQVLLALAEGDCRAGHWYEEGALVCFVYEDEPAPQCWTFWRSEGGLKARFAGDAPGSELQELARTAEPLQCHGPDVGA